MDAEERIEPGTTGTETAAAETAPETEVQEQTGSGPEDQPELRLSEDGDLDIADSFWEEKTPEESKTPETPKEPEPEYYTPEDFAKAYRSGQIDENKIRPELRDYYKSAAAAEMQKRDAAMLQRQAMEQARQAQPQQSQTPSLSWDQLMEAGKALASRYLGIKPEEFDEFDGKHQAARMMAVNEIRERASVAAQQDAARQRAYEQRVAGISDIYAEYRHKVPEMDEISQNFFPAWRQNLTVRQNQAVDFIMARGNETQLRQLLDAVVSDYKAYRTPQRNQAKEPVRRPPDVLSTRGTTGEASEGMVDISGFRDMSPEEQADFLIKYKFTA